MNTFYRDLKSNFCALVTFSVIGSTLCGCNSSDYSDLAFVGLKATPTPVNLTNNATPTPTASPVAAPSLHFSPSNGGVGSLVTITSSTGFDLSNTQTIKIGGVIATPLSISSSTVVGLVMPGATSGSVSVINSSTTVSSTTSFTVNATGTPVTQQGTKTAPTDNVGTSYFGNSVALSADGNTVLIGGWWDNAKAGSAWIYTRTSGVWTQQGSKITGSDLVGHAYFGQSVALSADGNTALIGGYYDNGAIGAAWIFNRSGGVWSQQGSKIVPTGILATYAEFGSAVSISSDGNTAIIGGVYDNSGMGAAWIYNRVSGVWSQTTKLIGTGNVGNASEGASVGMSGDGTTAFVTGYTDNSSAGAIWVYALSSGVWSQQGSKLVTSDNVGAAKLGQAGSISLDGNTIVAGGPYDNSSAGATWVFTRSSGTWSQQGTKLVGTGAVGAAFQGRTSSVSGDGNTIISSGYKDNSNIGATWVFTRSGTVWSQQGTKLVGTGNTGAALQGTALVLSGDGQTAIVCGDADNSNIGGFWTFTP